MKPRDLEEEIRRVKEGGPAKYREKLSEERKLFVRDRLQLFFREIAFEDGLLANVRKPDLPADGMVTGAGYLGDRKVWFMANDYTVKAGSMAEKGVEKFLRVQERALKTRLPILYLIDSSGGRITDQASFFAQRYGIGRFFYNHSVLSGVVPQICVLYGPCIAGAAYIPVFCDFTFMVRSTGSAMAIASPRMVEMVTGEVVELSELGGPDLHMKESGSCDRIVETEEDAAFEVSRLLEYLPDSFADPPPRFSPRPPERDPREADALVPEDPNRGYDVHELVKTIVDENSFFEIKPDYAPEMVVGFARIEGRTVGIVANNSAVKAGAIFPESSDKAADFIWKCDAFNIPLLYLCDTPGFMVGVEVERQGILRRGRRLIYATSLASVPKICVVVRKAYGAGIYAMGGPAFEPEATLAFPGAEIAIMGPEAAVNAVFRNHILKIPEGPERERFIEEKRREYRKDIDVLVAADDLVVDHVLVPSELRRELVRRFDVLETKRVTLPERRHGTVL